jgi:CspA family cold shock protein
MMNIIEDERLRGMQELEEHWNRLAKEKDDFQRRIQLGESRKRQENIVRSAGPGDGGGPRTIVQQSTNMVGKVKTYNSSKRFGFIMCDDVQQDIFVYQTHLVGRIALQQGEMVTFDYVIDNNRPQARNVRPYRSDADAAKGGGSAGEIEDAASQLFPKGTIVEVSGHPLDEWNGKVGAIQSYDKNGMTFAVDMGKLKLNLKPDYLRFKEKAPNAPDTKEEPKTASADNAKPAAAETAQKKEETATATAQAAAAAAQAQKTGQAAQAGAKQEQQAAGSQTTQKLDKEMHGIMKETHAGKHEHELSGEKGAAICITHMAGRWLYGYQTANPAKRGWVPKELFVDPKASDPPPPPVETAPVAPSAAAQGAQAETNLAPSSAEAAKAALEATLKAGKAASSTPEATEPVSEAQTTELESGKDKAGAPMLHGQAALDWLWAGKKDAPLKGADRFKKDAKEGSGAFQ